MRRSNRMKGLVVLAVIAILAALGTYAFTATNTVPASRAGDGSQTISGYTVTNVKYNLDALDPTKLASVEFDLDAAATTVKAKVSAAAVTWSSCTSGAPTLPNHWTCVVTDTVASADQLRVIAVQ